MAVKVVPGVNDLPTTHPDLMREWDTALNGKDPHTLVAGSTYHASWVCTHGHKWVTEVRKRGIRGHGCPYCSGQLPIAGVNDLATLHPELLTEWSPRNPQPPHNYLPGSGYKAWWKCSLGHEWRAIIETRTKRGYSCPVCMGRTIQHSTSVAGNPVLLSQWSSMNTEDPSEVGAGVSNKSYHWECSKGHTWKTAPYNRTQGKGCPKCIEWATSRAEKELQEYVRSILPGDYAVMTNDRTSIPPYELDLYIPALSVGIEFNGLYWHSTARKADKAYHAKKADHCSKADIRLLQVWEDDWRDKRPLVERMIARKLGVSTEPKVNARKCSIVSVTHKEARQFLDANHIQGGKNCSLYMGLKTEEKLVCVLGVTKYSHQWVIDRYASNSIVRGGFGKLLKHLSSITELPLVTFANREISDGDLYEKLGMAVDQLLPPDYCYLYKNKRHHKFGFRKARFKNDPELRFDSHLTEGELADLNSIPRIYDSGKVRYVLKGR